MSYKNEIFRQIYWNAMAMEIGTEFTLEQAFGEDWEDIPVAVKRQCCKEIKISVATKEVRGLIFLGKNSKGVYRYKRIPGRLAD
jgi:hypothetical protein